MRATIKSKIVEASPRLAVVKGKIVEVKGILSVVKGVIVEAWANGLKTMYKGISYLNSSLYYSFRTREGATLGTETKVYPYRTSIYDMSDDGQYFVYMFDSKWKALKYNESTGVYDDYGSTLSLPTGFSDTYKYRESYKYFWRLSRDGSYFCVIISGYNNTSSKPVLPLLVYKNTGSGFEHYKTVNLRTGTALSSGWTNMGEFITIDDNCKYLTYSCLEYRSSSEIVGFAEVYRMTDDDFNFTKIYGKSHTDTDNTFSESYVQSLIARSGKYALLSNAGGWMSSKRYLSYINKGTVTVSSITPTSGVNHLYHSRDEKNLYLRQGNGLYSYSVNGSTITQLGSITIGYKNSFNKFWPAYIDELEDGSLAIMETSNGLCLCQISKDANGMVTAYSEIKVLCYASSYGDLQWAIERARFIDTKY